MYSQFMMHGQKKHWISCDAVCHSLLFIVHSWRWHIDVEACWVYKCKCVHDFM